MSDFGDSAMPINRPKKFLFGDDLSADKPQSTPATLETYPQQEKYSNDEQIDYFVDNAYHDYLREVDIQTAKIKQENYDRRMGEYEAQSWDKKVLARTTGVRALLGYVGSALDLSAIAVGPTALAADPFLTRELVEFNGDPGDDYDFTNQDILELRSLKSGVESGQIPHSEYKKRFAEIKQRDDYTLSGLALILDKDKKAGVKEYPGEEGDIDINSAVTEGFKGIELTYRQTGNAVRDLFLTDKPDGFGRYIDEATRAKIQRGDAYMQAILDPTEAYQERLSMMGTWEKRLNDFIQMGPQVLGQVAAGAVGGVAGGTLFMFPQIFGQKYRAIIEAGGTPKEAWVSATLDGAGQGFLEAISMAFVLKGVPLPWMKNKAMRVITEGIIGGGTEMVTEYVQSYVDEFTLAIGDPGFKKEFMSKDWNGKKAMIGERMRNAHSQGKEEAIVAAAWGVLLGGGFGGHINAEVNARYNAKIDKIARERAGAALSEEIMGRAKKISKNIPTEVKFEADARRVFERAVQDVEENVSFGQEEQRQLALLESGRQMAPLEGAPVEGAPVEDAPLEGAPVVEEAGGPAALMVDEATLTEGEPAVASARAQERFPGNIWELSGVDESQLPSEARAMEGETNLPPEIAALKDTDPEAYQTYLDVSGLAEQAPAEKAKEAPAGKAKKAPKTTGRLSAGDKIERLWNRLDKKQQAKVKDLYDNTIEPMSDIVRYQMMQAGLSQDNLKVLDRPSLEQWRSTPDARTPSAKKTTGQKLYSKEETGRVGRQINRSIDAAYEIEYGKEAYDAELKLSESVEVERSKTEKVVTQTKERSTEKRVPGKPEQAKNAEASATLYQHFINRVTASGRTEQLMAVDPNKIKHVTKLTRVQEYLVQLAGELNLGPVAYFTTVDDILRNSNAYYLEGRGTLLNAEKDEGAFLALFGHESWHKIQKEDPELAKAVSDLFWKSVNQTLWKQYQADLNMALVANKQDPHTQAVWEGLNAKETAKKNAEGLEAMRAEFESDFVATKFADPVFMRKLIDALARKDQNLLVRLFNIINELLMLIKGVVQSEYYAYLRKDIEAVEDLLIEAYVAVKDKKAARLSPAVIDAATMELRSSIDMSKPEGIKSPAVMYNGKIYEAPIHTMGWMDIEKDLGRVVEWDEKDNGFVTTHDRFVGREEGNAIAEKANQVSKERNRDYLISEDLIKDISKTYSINENGYVQIFEPAAADDAALGLIDAVMKGHEYYLSYEMGNTGLIAESLGYEIESEVRSQAWPGGKKLYKYKGEIYDVNILAGRFAAAWNKDLKADERTAALLDAINETARTEGAGLVGSKQDRSQKKLDEYLKRSSKSYAEGEASTSKKEGVPTKNIRIKGGKSTMGMLQISSLRGKEVSTELGSSYFDLLYSKRDGYERPTDFWEIPTWMAQAAKSFKNADAYIVRNIEEAKAFLRASGYESIMVSAMDANKPFIKELAGSFDGDIIIGGYVDPKYFAGIKNIKFADSIKSAADLLKVPYKEGVDYRQFKGTRTIPRLEMSRGCSYKCHFCTVPKKIEINTGVADQIKSMAGLGYKLIYLNDKTFGQAGNFKDLVQINKQVKAQNPEFQGFIIQTTAPDFNKLSDEFLKESGIKYVELGVESYNDEILSNVNKPHRTKHIDEAASKIRRLGLNFIPNIISGMAGIKKGELWTETAETYRNTLNFLEKNKDIISHVNTTILSTYEGTETGKQLGTDKDADNDQNVLAKSWLQNRDVHEMFYRRLMEFGSRQLSQPDLKASIPMLKGSGKWKIKLQKLMDFREKNPDATAQETQKGTGLSKYDVDQLQELLGANDLKASISMPAKEDPVILPQKIRDDVDIYDLEIEDVGYVGYGDDVGKMFEALKMVHYLDLKLRSYEKIPEEKMDSFAKHYQKEAQKEFKIWSDHVMGTMKQTYDIWLARHDGPEGWWDSMFNDELELLPTELFTQGKIGYMKMGNEWEFDVSKDIVMAVEEAFPVPKYIDEDNTEALISALEEYGHDKADLQEESNENLWRLLDQEYALDQSFKFYGPEIDIDAIGEYIDARGGFDDAVGDVIRSVMLDKGYKAWRANFPSMDAAEERIRDQRKRMEDAKTDKAVMSAITLALNEQHVFGTMSQHMDIARNELDELNNIAENIYRFEDMLRRQYKPEGNPMPDRVKNLMASIEIPEHLKGFVKDSVVDRVVFHSTHADEDFSVFDFDKADLAPHFGTIEQADMIATPARSQFNWDEIFAALIKKETIGGVGGVPELTRIVPVVLNIENPLRLIDKGEWGSGFVVDQLIGHLRLGHNGDHNRKVIMELNEELDALSRENDTRKIPKDPLPSTATATEVSVVNGYGTGATFGSFGPMYHLLHRSRADENKIIVKHLKRLKDNDGSRFDGIVYVNRREIPVSIDKKVSSYFDDYGHTEYGDWHDFLTEASDEQWLEAIDPEQAMSESDMQEKYDSFMPFEPNQIKSVFNIAPTESPDIRQSIDVTELTRESLKGTKVVDNAGNPLLVYHSTYSDFDKFRTRRDTSANRMGAYFTASERYSEKFTGEGGRTIPVFLNITKPLDVSKISEDNYDGLAESIPGISEDAKRAVERGRWRGGTYTVLEGLDREYDLVPRLKKKGYDGIIFPHSIEGTTYVVFKPEQIISAISQPQLQQSIDLKAALKDKGVKVKVAGKTYTINEQRDSIEKLLELLGGSNGIKKFLTENGVNELLAGRIQSIGKNMEENPFPSPQETAKALLAQDKKDPKVKRWYDNINFLRDVFENDTDLNLFIGLAMLSHTSRNKGTLANMGEFIKFRMLNAAGQVGKGSKFGLVDVKTVSRVLSAKNIDEMFRIDWTNLKFKFGEVKVKAFAETFAAIMRDPAARNAVESVVDIWVGRYFFPSDPKSDDMPVAMTPVQHLRIQRHMREVESILTKKTGETWHPDMAQAVLWFHIRDEWEKVRGEKKGQKGYTFDETLVVYAERWSGAVNLDERQVRAYIKLKLRDPNVRHILDTYTQDSNLNVFDMVKGDDPLLLQLFDAAKLPKNYDIAGKTRHRVVIETDKIYNADVDPDGLIDKNFDPDDITTLLNFEKRLRDAGWVGLKSGEMTILLEPARSEPMKTASLGISNMTSPEVLEIIRTNFPQNYKKLLRYNRWYEEGNLAALDSAMRQELTKLFAHPLIDIRGIGPAEGRWAGGGREYSPAIEFDFANIDIAKGLLAQFLKDNGQYEGVLSERMSGWNDKQRPNGIAADQAPSLILKFKEALTEDQIIEITNMLDNSGIGGSQYSPEINALTIHHLKKRNRLRVSGVAIKYNDNIIHGPKSYEGLYKKAGINFKTLMESGGERGFITSDGTFVNSRKAKELKENFGKVIQSDKRFLRAAIDAIRVIQEKFPSYEGFGQVWYKHNILQNNWKINRKGEEYDKTIEKARIISNRLGLVAKPKIVSGEYRQGSELFKAQEGGRIGEGRKIPSQSVHLAKEFVKTDPIEGHIDANQAAQYQIWINSGVNIGPARTKQLEDFRAGKSVPVAGEQRGLFSSIPMNQKQAYLNSEAYSKAPNNLLGFSSDPSVQKGFYDTKYSYTVRVKVTYPKSNILPESTWIDEIRGLNMKHALERARRNWEGATVQFLGGYKNNERPTRVYQSITVYHGTGAEYGQYDLGYMSTGEGYQAFAWGMYMAGRKGLGEKYAKVAEKGAKLKNFVISLPEPGNAFQNEDPAAFGSVDYEVVKDGVARREFYKINVNEDGNLTSIIGPNGEASVAELARWKVTNFVINTAGRTLELMQADGDKISEAAAMEYISEALYDMYGLISDGSTRIHNNMLEARALITRADTTPGDLALWDRTEGEKILSETVLATPGIGEVNMEILDAVETELQAWEYAIGSKNAKVTTEGGLKIVHTVELSDDLVFIDWFKTIDKKLLDKIIEAAMKRDSFPIGNEAEKQFKNRLLNNPTVPLVKHVYGELTSVLGSKKEATHAFEDAGIDGVRFEADTMRGNTPKEVTYEMEQLHDAIYAVRHELSSRAVDAHYLVSKVVDHDPEFTEMAIDLVGESYIENLQHAMENKWDKNYVVFSKVQDPKYVQIVDKLYLSLDAFRVQERGAVDFINTKIGRAELSFNDKLTANFDYFTGKGEDKSNWRYLVFDKLDPIRQLLGGAEGHAYMKARGVPGAVGSLSAFLEHGKLYWDETMTIQVMKDPATKKTSLGKGFIPWVKGLGPNDGVKFFYWLVTKRAESLEKEGREHWLKKDDRDKLLAWVGIPENKQGRSWEQINTEFQAFNKNMLDIAEKAGVINKTSRESWESDLYIPFYRIIEDPVSAAEFWRSPPRAKDFLSSGIKRLTGGESKIGDPVENIMKNWTHLLNTSITNVARASGVHYATKNKILTGRTRIVKKNSYTIHNEVTGTIYDEFGTRKEAEEWKRDNITSNDLFSKKDIKIEKHTEEKEVFVPLIEEVPWSQTVVMKSQKDPATGKSTGVIYVHKKTGVQLLGYQKAGKMQYFTVNDPELYIAMSGMNPHQFDNAVMQFFRTSKRWLTYGATFGPGFKIANTIRDTLHTSLISKSFIPFVDTVKGFWKAWAENEAYVGYLASGHAFGGHYVKSEDPKVLANYIKKQLKGQNIADKFINQLMGTEGKTVLGRILDTPGKMLEFWERIGAASENAARVQLSENLLAKGKSTASAYFAARDLMDFQMSGASGIVQFLIQTIPFLNARGQGLYKMGRAVAEDPTSFAMKAFAISLASLGLWFLYKDDDRYKELEDWDRFAYYHFWIGDYHYRIPKPFETGVLFSTSVEAAGNVMVGNEDLGYIWTYLKHATTETFAFNPILGIQAVKPLAEQWANKVAFTGRPIEGQGLSGLRWGERYDPWTSETMRAIGGAVNLPPKRMEHLIRGYTGTFGMFILGMADTFTRNAFDFPDRPSLSWNEYPGFARFVKKGEARNTKFMTRFYDHYNEMQKLVRTVNYYDKLGDMKAVSKLINDNKEFYSLKKEFSKAARELARLNREIRLVWLNTRMSGDEKKRKLEVLTASRNKIVRAIYSKYKERN